MNIVAEAGVAAHWLYKAQQGHDSEHLSTQWLQSLLDIQNETRDAAEFWDHVKVDLFPDAVYVFTPKSEIMAMPRGATVVDFAYAIHSKIGNRTTAAKINDEEVPLRTELKSGDVVQIITSESSTPNPAWLSFVKTGRARPRFAPSSRTLRRAKQDSWAKPCWLRHCAPRASMPFRPRTMPTSPSGKRFCAPPATVRRPISWSISAWGAALHLWSPPA